MRWRRLLLLVSLTASLGWSAPPALAEGEPETLPRPDDVPEPLWRELARIDERIAKIETLRARFQRHRHTPLLRQPLVSEGVVYVQRDRARWESEGPSPSVTLVRGDEVRIYQPDERRLEIYPLDERAEGLGSGPLPRLTRMLESFALQETDANELFDDLDEPDDTDEPAGHDAANLLALRLTPRDEALAEELEELAMLLERETGRLLRLRTRGGPRQWTEYRFVDVELDVELPEDVFTLDLPDDVTVVRPTR